MITHSYITTVLNSHEIAQRQIRWLGKILSDNWELIFVDDGSDPEIPIPEGGPKNMTALRTYDKREWTQDIARNKAARVAQGQYLLFVDIDHVFTPEAIHIAGLFKGNALWFFRESAMLTEDLRLEFDDRPVYARPPNIFLVKAEVFRAIGGYPDQPGYGNDIGVVAELEKTTGGQIPLDHMSIIGVILEDRAKFHDLKRPW